MSGDIRPMLQNTAGRLKRRGIDQTLDTEDMYFPEESNLNVSADGDRSRFSHQTNFPIKTRVWLKISDFNWIGGIVDKLDERLIFDTPLFKLRPPLRA